MQPGVSERTAKVASTYPVDATKNSCKPLLACSSVSVCGSVGTLLGSPVAVAVKMRLFRSTLTVDVIVSSEAGRSGVLKYAKPGTVSSSS